MIEQLNATTFEETMPSGDKVEIGDKDSPDFKPHLKLNRWNGECAIDLSLATAEKILPIVKADKVIWEGNEIACEFIPQPPSKGAELGGFKFNIILKKKPETNVSVLNFNAKGLKFYYQPALTPEEIADGVVRPDDVVGSYAVYHATRTNMHASKEDAEKYKCGKAFHWYRPLIWDSSNPRKEVWGELNVDPVKGQRTVTIPQDFLDNAVYPVTIDDTFGHTTKGATWVTRNNMIHGTYFLGAAGTGVSITCYLEQESTDTPNVEFALYKQSDNSYIVDTDQWQLTSDWDGWKTLDFTSPPTLEAIDYWLLQWNSPTSLNIYLDTIGTAGGREYDVGFPSWPGTFSPTAETKKYSIYCTYTPSAGETHYGAATLSGVGTLAGIGRGIFIGKTTLTGTGTLTAIGSFLRYAKATLSGTGTLSAIAGVWKLGSAALSGTGSLVAKGVRIFAGKATLTGAGSLSAVGRGIFVGSATLAGTGTLKAIGSIVKVGRLLKVAVITSQYRLVKIITAQYRKVKSFTGFGG